MSDISCKKDAQNILASKPSGHLPVQIPRRAALKRSARYV